MISRNISSLQHPFVKYLVKLRKDKGFRATEQKVLLCGQKQIQELSAFVPLRTLIFSDKECAKTLKAEEAYEVPKDILKKITGLESPEPLAAVVDIPPFADLSKTHHLLVLDGLSDPGNLGTVLRSALALGWDGVFITEKSCDPFNEKALQAAKGAPFKLPFRIGSWDELQALLQKKGSHVFVADLKGTPFTEISFKKPVALILGNEAHGPSSLAKKHYASISIPMEGNMESLNVATAGSILLYHIKAHS